MASSPRSGAVGGVFPPRQGMYDPAFEKDACGLAMVATLRGDYTGVGDVMASLGAFVAERGLETGPMFNVYRVGPQQSPDPADWVTDVCLPVVR